MNFKKLKRMLSIVLSATMILSTNMTGFAAELAAPAEAVAEQESHEHNWQLDEVLEEATAEEAGIGVYVCDECDATQTGAIDPTDPISEAGEQDSVKEIVIPEKTVSSQVSFKSSNELTARTTAEEECKANNTHNVVRKSRVLPTCFETGMSAHYWCETCKSEYITQDADHVLTEEERTNLVIEKKDHNSKRVSRLIPATCTDKGTKEYFTCDNCENLYLTPEDLYADCSAKDENDEFIRTNVELEDTIIPALGHSYVDEDGESTCVFSATFDPKSM